MDTQQILVLSGLGIAVVAFLVWSVHSWLQARRLARENTQRMAAALGLAPVASRGLSGLFKVTPLFAGTFRDRKVEFFQQRVNSGNRSRRTNLRSILTVATKIPDNLTFDLDKPDFTIMKHQRGRNTLDIGALFNLVSAFVTEDIKLGDEAFDKAWRLNASDAAFAQAVFGPEIRPHLTGTTSAGAYTGTLTLARGTLHYLETGPFEDEQRWQRFVAIASLFCKMADQAEAYAAAKP